MKNILLIATGSVAIEKFERIFLLLKEKYNIKIVVSEYVRTNFDFKNQIPIEKIKYKLNTYPQHIELVKWAHLIVVVPATANTIAKFNAGIADNFITTILIAARQKILFVPAMNTYMYKSLQERKIISNLSNYGHMFLGPYVGILKEKEVGLGRMAEPEEIFSVINNILKNNTRKKILVSLGASKVYIDPIRYITNKATGSFGSLISKELRMLGQDVEILNVSDISNQKALEIIKNTKFDTYISTAAFADYDVVHFSDNKIKKSSMQSIKLKDNVDVLYELSKFKFDIYGFKLDNEKQNAIAKMDKLKLKGIIWNKIPATGFNKITGSLIMQENEIHFKNTSKNEAAKIIAKAIVNG